MTRTKDATQGFKSSDEGLIERLSSKKQATRRAPTSTEGKAWATKDELQVKLQEQGDEGRQERTKQQGNRRNRETDDASSRSTTRLKEQGAHVGV